MSSKKILLAIVASSCMYGSSLNAEFRSLYNDLEYILSGVFKPETFYGKNINWLNNDNDFDKGYFSRHTLDLMIDLLYGNKTYGSNIVEFFFQMRNKGVWGNPESIASTTTSDIKVLEAIKGSHKHGFPRHIFWIRQLWLQFSINDAFSLPFKNKHSFVIGSFPFQLGRGIALGDAFAVGPEILGFYADSAIDQYAFGAKFSGELFPKVLSYDLYTAILQNNSTGIADTEKKILGQEIGRLNTPSRGFGKINYIMAGRFNWNIFDNAWLGRMNLEPYGLYNNDPEQKIEFPADATSKLGTAGLAGEFYGKRFECGFDYAVNFGQQRVKGWDRNIIKENNRQAVVVLVNDNVTATYNDAQGNSVTEPCPYVPGSEAQKLINEKDKDENQNEQKIGEVTSVGYLIGSDTNLIILKNSKGRFGKAYTNKYEGWMFVADAAYSFLEKDLIIAVTAGVTSGDDNPNIESKDGNYAGFIGLQEVYSGKRVRSVFLLGGAGRVKRFLSTPSAVSTEAIQAPSKEAQAISGFTNLIFCGTSLKWKPKSWKKPFEINPNVLALWQERNIGKARTFLGVETGLFINYSLLKDLKLFWVSSLFFPGSHYKDRMGTPVLSQAQLDDLDSGDPTGYTQDRITKQGASVAYTFNLGLIYSF